mgnify:CR=1 FL=1
METAILSGLDASKALYQSLEERIARLKDQNITPGLAAVLVGNNPASEIYVKNKTKKFEALGLLEYEHAPDDFEVDWVELEKPLENFNEIPEAI